MTQPVLSLDCLWSGKSTHVEIREPTVVGRSSEAGLMIPLENVSRRHAKLEPRGSSWFLVDMGSLNGAEVNGVHVIKETELHTGDVINVGSATLRVTIEGQTAPQPQPIQPRQPPIAAAAAFSLDRSVVVAARSMVDVLGTTRSGAETVGAAPPPNWALGLARESAETLLKHESLEASLEALLKQAAVHLPAERGAISLIEGEGGELVPRASFGFREAPSISRQLTTRVITNSEAVVIEEVGVGDTSAQHSLLMTRVRSVACAPLYHRDTVRGIIYLDRQSGGRKFKPSDLDVLGAIGCFAAIGIEQKQARDTIREEQRMRSSLERYSSPQVVERIIRHNAPTGMIAEEQEVTVLFADLCAFTAMSEGMIPVQVAMLLNSVFDRLTEIVFAHEGTLDKFIGDGMMAFFGAPAHVDAHPVKAVRAAWDMRQALVALNEEFGLETPIRIRYGINSGPVVVGDIGSHQRRDYTVIGDTVNVASRLEGIADPDDIVVGKNTWEASRDEFEFEALEPILVKNRREPVHRYRVVGKR